MRTATTRGTRNNTAKIRRCDSNKTIIINRGARTRRPQHVAARLDLSGPGVENLFHSERHNLKIFNTSQKCFILFF